MKSITFKSRVSSNVAKFLENSRAKLHKQDRELERYDIILAPQGISSATIYFL